MVMPKRNMPVVIERATKPMLDRSFDITIIGYEEINEQHDGFVIVAGCKMTKDEKDKITEELQSALQHQELHQCVGTGVVYFDVSPPANPLTIKQRDKCRRNRQVAINFVSPGKAVLVADININLYEVANVVAHIRSLVKYLRPIVKYSNATAANVLWKYAAILFGGTCKISVGGNKVAVTVNLCGMPLTIKIDFNTRCVRHDIASPLLFAVIKKEILRWVNPVEPDSLTPGYFF